MRSRFTIFVTTLVMLLAGSGFAIAHDHLLPFMTVAEYTEVHPQQAALMDAFEARVKKAGKPCPVQLSRPVKIAFVSPGLQISDYWRRSVTSFKKRMAELGVPCTVEEFFSKPAIDQSLQTLHIQKALEGNPDYLVFTLDVFKHKTMIESILRRPSPKVILQNVTTPLRDWEGRQPFMYIGFDHAKGTKILADYFKKKLGNQGRYGLLYFTHGYVSTMRGETFRNFMEKTSEIVMVDSAYTNGKSDKAYAAARTMIRDHDPDFIYATSTDIAMGAIQALESENAEDTMVNGWGGGSYELDAIRDGKLDVTVMRMNDDNGVAMAEAICLDIMDKADQVPTIFSGEMVLVEKGISKSALDALIRKAFRYSEN